ncbi:MAG: formylglycine-generating enzyme family protein [bacterium]
MNKRDVIALIIALVVALLFGLNVSISRNKNKPVIADMKFIGENSRGYEEYLNEKDSSVMILVPEGNFMMGDDAHEIGEEPKHQVYLDEYYIGKYEVTNQQYKRFCDETKREYPKDPEFKGMEQYFTKYPNYPVVMVTWHDAQAYCKWSGMRLPTEAEWEKAARSSDSRTYPWGDDDPSDGRYCNHTFNESDYHYDERYVVYADDGYEYTSPVGLFEWGVSPYGCYDMAGNVWEWCFDWYGWDAYRNSLKDNPKGPQKGELKVIRGGSFYFSFSSIRSAFRVGSDPQFGFLHTGFRPSCAVKP